MDWLHALILYKNDIQFETRRRLQNQPPALILYKNDIQFEYKSPIFNNLNSALILYKNDIQLNFLEKKDDKFICVNPL